MPKYDFAFIVHPRSKRELIDYSFLFQFVPDALLYAIPPRIIGDVILARKDKHFRGALIGIMNTPSQFLNRGSRIKKKILNAVRIAQESGAKIVGLGSLSSPAVSGGLDIQNQPDIAITNGNAFTAAVVSKDIKHLATLLKSHKKKVRIAIVGATGSIGQAVARSLVHIADNMVLVSRTREKLTELRDDLMAQKPISGIATSTSVADISDSNVIIVATSHHETVIRPKHARAGAIVYDITQPTNLSKKEWEARHDILVVQGGIVLFPGMRADKITGLSEEESFACLAETALLAITHNTGKDFSIGYVTQENMHSISALAEKFHVSSLLKKWGARIDWDFINEFIQSHA